MRHMLRQFGPCLKWPWTKLEAPELTEELIDRMVEGTQAQAAGRSIRELERLRDDYLVAIQQVLRQFNLGAGATLRALEERLYEEGAAAARPALEAAAAGAQPAVLRLIETEVRPEWVDYNGHMTDSRYLQVFGDATDVLLRYAGVDDAYRRSGRALYTVETHVTHQAEARALEPLYVATPRARGGRQARAAVPHAAPAARRRARWRPRSSCYLHVELDGGESGAHGAAGARAARCAAGGAGTPPGAARGRPARPQGAALRPRGASLPKIVDHERRRDEIALVACRVVAAYGFDQATIVRIAREAGYTTGMVAHYFDTKQEIVIAALRLILRRIEERLTAAAGDGAGPARAAQRSAAGRCHALHRVRVLDGLLGPGVGRQAPEAHQRLGAPRVPASSSSAAWHADWPRVGGAGRPRCAPRCCARSSRSSMA